MHGSTTYKANFNSCLLSSWADDIYPVLIICFVYKMNPFQKLAKHSFYLCYKHLPQFIFVNIPVSYLDNNFGTILILKSQSHFVDKQQTIKVHYAFWVQILAQIEVTPCVKKIQVYRSTAFWPNTSWFSLINEEQCIFQMIECTFMAQYGCSLNHFIHLLTSQILPNHLAWLSFQNKNLKANQPCKKVDLFLQNHKNFFITCTVL